MLIIIDRGSKIEEVDMWATNLEAKFDGGLPQIDENMKIKWVTEYRVSP